MVWKVAALLYATGPRLLLQRCWLGFHGQHQGLSLSTLWHGHHLNNEFLPPRCRRVGIMLEASWKYIPPKEHTCQLHSQSKAKGVPGEMLLVEALCAFQGLVMPSHRSSCSFCSTSVSWGCCPPGPAETLPGRENWSCQGSGSPWLPPYMGLSRGSRGSQSWLGGAICEDSIRKAPETNQDLPEETLLHLQQKWLWSLVSLSVEFATNTLPICLGLRACTPHTCLLGPRSSPGQWTGRGLMLRCRV